MTCTHHATVRFFDVDRAGIAFFAAVFPLCHAAWEEVMAQVFAPASLEEAVADGRWRLPVVRAEADFRAPMRLGDRLAVMPRIHRLGARSLAVDYTVVGADDGVVRAEVRLTHAAVAAATNGGGGGGGDEASGAEGTGDMCRPRSVALSDSLRAKLKEVLGETG